MDSMTDVQRRAMIAGAHRPAAVQAILAATVRIAMGFWVALERSQRRRALVALNDHLLRDIGLTADDFVASPRSWNNGLFYPSADPADEQR
jgi:uncharacterized protein YjiS (DUF1127 family)